MSQYNYITTAHKPSAVSHSVVGPFMTADTDSLIVGKVNIVEIYSLQDAKVPVAQFTVFGRIAVLELMAARQHPGETGYRQDIFLLTEKKKFSVLTYDSKTDQIATLCHGDSSHPNARLPERALCTIDPHGRFVLLHIYEGLLQMLPLDKNGSGCITEAFGMRVDDYQISQISLLNPANIADSIQLCVTFVHVTGDTHLKIYTINVQDEKLIARHSLELGRDAFHVIPASRMHGGAYVLGHRSVAYYSVESNMLTHVAQRQAVCRVTCYGKIDDTRYLVGNEAGDLSLLMVLISKDGRNNVTGLRWEELGVINTPSRLSYLDSGYVFVGSSFGDSQLIKLLTESERKAHNSTDYVHVVETYDNIGAILDFVIIDDKYKTQKQLVTCSGAFKNGSLRVITNGVGFHKIAQLVVKGVKQLWSCTNTRGASGFLALSFAEQTRFLVMRDQVLSEADDTRFPCGFVTDEASLLVATTPSLSDDFELVTVQVTATAVVACRGMLTDNRVKLTLEQLQSESAALAQASGFRVAAHSAATGDVFVATGRGCLAQVQINSEEEALTAGLGTVLQFQQEIACLAVDPSGQWLAVALWNSTQVHVVKIHSDSLEKHSVLQLSGAAVLPRSLLFADFSDVQPQRLNDNNSDDAMDTGDETEEKQLAEQAMFLFCGLGDGRLVYSSFEADPGTLGEVSEIVLGTQPVYVKSHRDQNGGAQVVAICDRPRIVSLDQQKPTRSNNPKTLVQSKLRFSHLNVKLTSVATFHTVGFPHCVAITTRGTLSIGRFDDTHKLHVRKVPLGEGPWRIAHDETSHTLAVTTTRMLIPGDTFESVAVQHDSIAQLVRPSSSSESKRSASTMATGMILEADSDDEDEEMLDPVLETDSEVKKRRRLNSQAASDAQQRLAATQQPQGQQAHEVGFVRLFDEYTLKPLWCIALEPFETADSLITMQFRADEEPFYVIGTSYYYGENPEKGRILIYKVEDKALVLVAKTYTKGAVCALAAFKGKLVAGVNSTVLVFELTYTVNEEGSSPNTLKLLCGHSGNINVLHLRVHNNIIAVADVMRGVSLMLFRRKASERQSDSLLQIARDETPVWTMALAALSDAQFLVSTNNMNLLTVSRNKEATDVETRARLLMSGGIHLGHYVNQIRRGWIGHEPTATENSGIVDSHLFACQSGMIGVVASLKKTKFEFLEKLEQVLLNGKYVCAVGGLVHSSYRNFMYQMQNVHHIKEGFVDGDVVEQVLTLSRPQREAVAAKMQVTVQELQAEVADMLRLV